MKIQQKTFHAIIFFDVIFPFWPCLQPIDQPYQQLPYPIFVFLIDLAVFLNIFIPFFFLTHIILLYRTYMALCIIFLFCLDIPQYNFLFQEQVCLNYLINLVIILMAIIFSHQSLNLVAVDLQHLQLINLFVILILPSLQLGQEVGVVWHLKPQEHLMVVLIIYYTKVQAFQGK